MGFNDPATRITLPLTLPLTSTYFGIGFCGSIYTVVYNSTSIYNPTASGITWISMTYTIAIFVGALSTWPLSAACNLDRRIITLTGLALLYLGCLLATSFTTYAQILAAGAFYGLGTGMLYVSGMVWMVEMAQAKSRGRQVVLLWICASAGNAVAAWIKLGFQYVPYSSGAAQLRVPLGLQLLVLLVPLFLVWKADESWRWLLQRSQPDKARAVLAKHMLASQSTPEFEQAFAAIVREQRQSSGSRTLFSSKHSVPGSPQLRPWRRLFLAVLLQTADKVCGYTVVSQYVSTAAISLGRSSGASRLALITALPTFFFIFSLIPYALIDRPSFSTFSPFGRRGLLMLSALGLSIMFLLATIVSAAKGNFSNEYWFGPEYRTTELLMGYFFIFLFASLFYLLGFRTVTDLYSAETAASNIRLETLSIALAWGFAVDVAIAFAVSFGIYSLGAAFFLVWLFVNLVLVVIVFLLYPETQARNLEQMDENFASGLKVLAGTDRAVRRGRKISPGIGEFDGLLSGGDPGLTAELGNEQRAGVGSEVECPSAPGK